MAKAVVFHGLNTGMGDLTVKAYRREDHAAYADASRDTQRNGAAETAVEETNRKGTYYAASVTDGAAGDLTGPHLLQVYDVGGDFIGDFWADMTPTGTAAAPIVALYAMTDAMAVSGDSAAAANAESFFDGTGYVGTNNVIPTVNTVNNTLALAGAATVVLTDGSLITAKLGTFVLAKNTNITGFNDLSAAEANAEVDTALTDAGVTLARMGYLDNLSAGPVALAATALSSAQWTNVRAGYLDNLNVGGLVASSSEATAIQNNTRVVRVVPDIIERPDAGTTTYRIELLLYDEAGNMETPDSAPTIILVNQDGTDRSSRLDSTTMTLVSTGRYRTVYTASTGDAVEQLVWTFTIVEGGVTRLYGNQSIVVDTTAVDFTAADRTKLEAVYTKLPSKTYLTGSNNADGDVQMDEATGDFPGSVGSVAGVTFPTNFSLLSIGADGTVIIGASTCNRIADHVRRRTQANVEASADGDALSKSSMYGFIQQAQESNTSDNAGFLTIYKTDGVTEVGRLAVTSDSAADPIVGVS